MEPGFEPGRAGSKVVPLTPSTPPQNPGLAVAPDCHTLLIERQK